MRFAMGGDDSVLGLGGGVEDACLEHLVELGTVHLVYGDRALGAIGFLV